MAKNNKIEASDDSFFYWRKWDETPVVSNYNIHTHEEYELLIFIRGDASFIVEGVEHPLSPMDAIVTCPGEMHQIYLRSVSSYERVVLSLNDQFFVNNDCVRYRDIFTNREMGTENIIRSDSIKNSAILDAVERIDRYINEGEDNEVVIRCAVIELLHALNQLKPEKTTGLPQSVAVRKTSAYINRNLTGELSLDVLAEQLFVSKYYLCRIFKKYTGMTIGRYITHKRLMLAKDLYQNGHSLSEAAALSGFADYSAFYKACVKETGQPPRKGIYKALSMNG